MIYGRVSLGNQALARAARAFATNRGIKDTKALEKSVVDEITSKLGRGMDLEPQTLASLATIVLRDAEKMQQGGYTAAERDEFSRKTIEDLKSRHVSMRRVSAVVHGTNAWLRAHHPEVHKTLKQNEERGGALGSHPFIARHLTDRYLQHEQEQERIAKRSKWPSKTRADQVAASVGPGGLLGNRNASAAPAIQALRNLARSPLGSSLDVA